MKFLRVVRHGDNNKLHSNCPKALLKFYTCFVTINTDRVGNELMVVLGRGCLASISHIFFIHIIKGLSLLRFIV